MAAAQSEAGVHRISQQPGRTQRDVTESGAEHGVEGAFAAVSHRVRGGRDAGVDGAEALRNEVGSGARGERTLELVGTRRERGVLASRR